MTTCIQTIQMVPEAQVHWSFGLVELPQSHVCPHKPHVERHQSRSGLRSLYARQLPASACAWHVESGQVCPPKVSPVSQATDGARVGTGVGAGVGVGVGDGVGEQSCPSAWHDAAQLSHRIPLIALPNKLPRTVRRSVVHITPRALPKPTAPTGPPHPPIAKCVTKFLQCAGHSLVGTSCGEEVGDAGAVCTSLVAPVP